MNPSEVIENAAKNGVILTFSPVGTIKMAGDQTAVDKWLPTIRNHKPEILHELQRMHERARVIAMLEATTGNRYFFCVSDASADPIVVTVGIRNIASFNLEIPQKYYDGIALLELIEKYAGDKNANI